MIISASRRTDIPAFHSEWLMNRLRAGYCLVRNPVYRPVVYRVDLSRTNVDCLVFVTKNPAPLEPHLREIASMGHMYMFEVTITPYGKDLEPNVPPSAEVCESFRRISERIGKDRCLWRYDPILLNRYISPEYHRRKFELLCKELEGYTDRCIFSFVDLYSKLLGKEDLFRSLSHDEMDTIASYMKPVADRYGIELTYCCAHYDLSSHGIEPRGCIDGRQMRRLNIPYEEMSTPLRDGCRCVKNIDIGEYDTCPHDCLYCYANRAKGEERGNRTYDPEAEMLYGGLEEGDTVVDLKGRSDHRLSDYFDYTQYGDVGKNLRRSLRFRLLFLRQLPLHPLLREQHGVHERHPNDLDHDGCGDGHHRGSEEGRVGGEHACAQGERDPLVLIRYHEDVGHPRGPVDAHPLLHELGGEAEADVAEGGDGHEDRQY